MRKRYNVSLFFYRLARVFKTRVIYKTSDGHSLDLKLRSAWDFSMILWSIKQNNSNNLLFWIHWKTMRCDSNMLTYQLNFLLERNNVFTDEEISCIIFAVHAMSESRHLVSNLPIFNHISSFIKWFLFKYLHKSSASFTLLNN